MPVCNTHEIVLNSQTELLQCDRLLLPAAGEAFCTLTGSRSYEGNEEVNKAHVLFVLFMSFVLQS